MLNKIRNSAGLQQSALLIGGNFLATIFSAVGLILISRSVGPALFGEFTVGYSLMVILVRFQGLGLNVALQKIAGKYFAAGNWQTKVNALFQAGTGITLSLAILFALLGLGLAQPLARVLNTDESIIILGSFIFSGITLLFEYFITIFQIMHRFAASVYMMLAQSGLKLLFGVVILVMGLNQVDLLFYVFYSLPILAILLGIKLLPTEVKIWPPRLTPEVSQQLTTVLKHTAILMATAGFIDYVDVLFVKRYSTPFETGVYGGISQLATGVMMVGYSLAAVLNSRVARYHTIEHLSAYVRKACLILLVAVVGYLVYLPLAELSILITIGEAYLIGAPLLKILMASSFLLIATVPLIALFYSFDIPLYFSISGIGQLIIVLIGGQFFIAEYGLEAAVWTRVASRVFLFGLTLVWAIYAYQQKKREAA